MRAKSSFDAAGLKKKVQKANITSLAQAGAYTRGMAQRSIKIVNKPRQYKTIEFRDRRGRLRKQKVSISVNASAPGKPPHSRFGDLKHAIIFEAGESSVVIGPTYNRMGDVARVHEFGGKRDRPSVYYQTTWGGGKRMRKEVRRFRPTYPARPFMAPALERIIPRLPEHWSNSIR